MALGLRALVTASTMPLVALSLWATGGATSFIQPVMIFTALFIAYFFPPRMAWPLMALFIYAFATPLFYDNTRALDVGYPARLVMFGLAVTGTTMAVQFLKGRLVRAEMHQRTMAELDPLTGVANRRGFDLALERAAATGGPYALILIDLDDFKRVNDEQGHPAGDAVLQSVAIAAAGVARQNDCLARIGGDEFALIAPGAGPAGALRLLRDLRDSVMYAATYAAALVPEDAGTPDELVACADARLLAQKRDGQARERHPGLGHDDPAGRHAPPPKLASGRVRLIAAAAAAVVVLVSAAPAVAAERPIGDGAWSWFGDPRAVTHNGRTYVGWVDQEGDVKVSSYDHATGERVTAVLQARLNQDDHANPSLQVRPDGRLVVYYSAHVGPVDALPRVLPSQRT